MDEAILKRFDAIERENRRMKWLLGCVAFGAIILAVEGSPRVRRRGRIEGDSLAIRDRSGKVRASIELAQDGAPRLQMFDAGGRETVGLRSNDEATSLNLFDHGRARISLATTAEGASNLELRGIDAGSSASLFLWPDRTAGLSLVDDRNGVMIGVQPDQLTGLCVTDGDGVERGRVGNLPADAQPLGLTLRDGKAPFRIKALPPGRPKPAAEVPEATVGADVLGEVDLDQPAYTDWPESTR